MKRGLIVILALLLMALPVMAQEDLTETYTAAEGGIVFQHPAGWYFEDGYGIVSGANTEAAFSADSNTLTGDDLQMFIMSIAPEDLGLTGGDGASELLNQLATSLLETEADATISEIEQLTLGGYDAAYLQASDSTIDVLFLLMNIEGDEYILFGGATGPGSIGLYRDTMLAMAETFEIDLALIEAAMNADFEFENLAIDASILPAPTTGTGNVVWQLQYEETYDYTNPGPMQSIALAGDGTLYAGTSFGYVMAIGQDGTAQVIFAPEGMNSVADIAVAEDGTLWAIDPYTSALYHLDTEGNILAQSADGALDAPYNLAISPDGTIYVFDDVNDGGGRVVVFDSNAQMQSEFLMSEDPDDFEFGYEVALTVGPDGTLYAGTTFGTIRAFDASGTMLNENVIGTAMDYNGVQAFEVDAEGNFYIAASDGTLYHIAPNGTILHEMGTRQNQPEDFSDAPPFEMGEFYNPSGLVLLPDGSIVVTDSNFAFSQAVRLTFGE